ncbi:kinocilin-like [Xenopus laevis]|uniref:Kinocilin-like n=1 Tax=Xenopus laevis TaxID=8355 RepID=A0A8J1MUS2_XENLA|nr:kinocilin-like [Xenopus laevis]
MNPVSTNEYYGLRVASALIGIVAGSIIVGVSDSCGAAAVGGIFLGAAGFALLISISPFIKAWLNFNQMLPFLGHARIQPYPSANNEEMTNEPAKRESSLGPMKDSSDGKTLNINPMAHIISPDEGTSSGPPDLIAQKPHQLSAN